MSISFPALGFDPAPGDPAAVGALGREAGRVTTELGTLGEQLRRLGEVDAQWQGTAAEAFVQLLRQLPESLRETEAAFGILATQLSGWEVTLIELQASARALEVEAQASRDRRAVLWQGAPALEPVPVPPVRFGPSTGQALIGAPTAPGDTQEAGARARTALLDAYEQELATILGRARELQRRATREGDLVAAAVRTATSYAPPPPGVFERVGDWFGELDRAVGNLVNDNIGVLTTLADAATVLGLIAMAIPGIGWVPGLVLGGLALATSGALARYADGPMTDVALAAAGVGVGRAAAYVGRRAALARADEMGTAVQPPRPFWSTVGSGPREGTWLWTNVIVTFPLGFGLSFNGVAVAAVGWQGRQPPSPDDPKPRLQLSLPSSPALQVPKGGGPASGATGAPGTPATGEPEAGRRPEPRHLSPTSSNGVGDLAPMPSVGPAGLPSSDSPARRPTTVGGP